MIGGAEWVSLGINFSGLCYDQRSGLSPLDRITEKNNVECDSLADTKKILTLSYFNGSPNKNIVMKIFVEILFSKGSNISNISDEKYS